MKIFKLENYLFYMNKRGMNNHVEMVLASLMFFMFFFFVITFLQPYKTDTLTTSVVDGIYYNLENNVSIDVREIAVRVEDNSEDCFSVSLEQNADFGAIVFNVDRIKVNSGFLEGKLNIDSNSHFFYVLFSEDFPLIWTSTSCSPSENYSVGGIFDYKVFSAKKLEQIRNMYYSDYDKLKNLLGVPAQFEFSVESESISMVKNIPEDSNVVAKEYVEKVMDADGNVIVEDFFIRVW